MHCLQLPVMMVLVAGSTFRGCDDDAASSTDTSTTAVADTVAGDTPVAADAPAAADVGPNADVASPDVPASDTPTPVDVPPDVAADVPVAVPLGSDQCTNAADEAAYAALATVDKSGPEVAGDVAGGCPLSACGGEVAEVLFDQSQEVRDRLGACIAQCLVDQTGLSEGCSACYGFIGACAAAECLTECSKDSAGAPCRDCVDLHCTDTYDDCTGL